MEVILFSVCRFRWVFPGDNIIVPKKRLVGEIFHDILLVSAFVTLYENTFFCNLYKVKILFVSK